ncbi:MAG: hypothetical protein O3A00_07555 [Planctomycetota bacterium]|nr:hypothetical protein [Planctomycetota bacterium]
MPAFEDLIILIPSHSLEDFPTEPNEKDAGGLLNAFSVAWHPVLMGTSKVVANWHRADEPPDTVENRLILVPTACESWLPGGWKKRAIEDGATVVVVDKDRDAAVQAAIAPVECDAEIDPDLVADFLALGTAYLQMELLTRQMHYFSNLDEVHLHREAISAAEAALANDGSTAQTHLRGCFESLMEARERFYPVDCYLLDVCLVVPEHADDKLEAVLDSGKTTNFMISGADLQQIADEKPQLIAKLRDAWDAGTISILGGEYDECATSLLPLGSAMWDFERGHQLFRKLFNRTPKTWARRRFGFTSQHPQLLRKYGYHGALHIALDDGIYPDAEQSRIQWEGCDGNLIDAFTRIPLAGDSASSYLRFPMRMAETMEQDHVAGLMFARWPDVRAPWFDDFRRMQKYSQCLGRWVTVEEFFSDTDAAGRLSKHDAEEYFSPYLIQHAARRDPDPSSRFAKHFIRRHRYERAEFFDRTAKALLNQVLNCDDDFERETIVEKGGPDADAADIAHAEQVIGEFESASVERLASLVMSGAAEQAGFLVLNSLSFARTVTVELPDLIACPKAEGPIKYVQFDEQRKAVTLEVPGSGFAWIPNGGPNSVQPAVTKTPMAEAFLLRAEHFEVILNEATGGIQKVKGHGRSPNRLSQQLAFRFPRERKFEKQVGEDVIEDSSYYSEMRIESSEVTCAGPFLGEIVTTGRIVDQTNNARVAGFKQTTRVWRGRNVLEVDIELDTDRTVEGDPWSNYFVSRFAWNDPAAALTRTVLQQAQGFRMERFESPYYFEMASPSERTTIVNMGLPFHRKIGMRMLDSILIPEGESQRHFRFVVVLDDAYPMQAAMDAMVPVHVMPTKTGPPRMGDSGWFFHIPERNVQIQRVMPIIVPPPDELSELGNDLETENDAPEEPTEEAAPPRGFVLRLIETEGRARQVHLKCFRTPHLARSRDFHGRPLVGLNIEDDTILIDMTAYEIVDVELHC